MNKPVKIALAGIMGTNVMTLFSYLVSALAKENFSEPDHLSTMINRLAPGISKKWLKVAGWGAHYAVGILFAAVYAELWENGTIKPSVKNGLMIGVLSGAIAVLIWKATFKVHPLPPWIDFKNYYLQLVPAHVVFAVIATITHRLICLQKENNSA
jgi:hypothetical protein